MSLLVENSLIVVIATQDEGKCFAWDILSDALVVPVDTFEEVSLKLEKEFTPLVRLEQSGTWETEHTNPEGNLPEASYGLHWFVTRVGDRINPNYIAPTNSDHSTWNYDIITRAREEEGVSLSGSEVGYFFVIEPGAFYSSSEGYWEDGDTLSFSTIQGDSSATIIAKNSAGAFDTSKLYVDILGSITETWVLTLVVFDLYSHVFHIRGLMTGNVYESNVAIQNQYISTDYAPGLTYIPSGPPDMYKPPTGYVEIPEEGNLALAAYFYYTEDSYIGTNTIREFAGDEGLVYNVWKDEFEAMSGYSWPMANIAPYGEEGSIIRECIFYNPLLGPDYANVSPLAGRVKATMALLYDSWDSGDWSQPALFDSTYMQVAGYPSGPGVINEIPWYAYNRQDWGAMVGVAKSYEAIGESDPVEKIAWVVADAYAICDYVGKEDEIEHFKVGINISYRMMRMKNSTEQALFDLINTERTNMGLEALVYNHKLQVSGGNHSKDMVTNDFFSHQGSDTSWVSMRMRDAGYYSPSIELYFAKGENLAIQPPGVELAAIVAGWMASPGHRANILNPEFTEAGMAGAADVSGNTYYTQNFGGRERGWPGFGSFNTKKLTTYLNDTIKRSDIQEFDGFLKIYTAQKIIEKEI